MELLQNLSDDQIVVIGATVTLACCVGLMYLSHGLSKSQVDGSRRQPAREPVRAVVPTAKAATRHRDAA